MSFVRAGYVCRVPLMGRTHRRGKVKKHQTVRNWWMIKSRGSGSGVGLDLNNVIFPKEDLGKKVRFKVEYIDDEGGKK